MNLKVELQNYGVANFRLFGDSAKPELLDYLDLVEPRASSGLLPDGVAESQGRPLLFFVNESHLAQTPNTQENNYRELRRKLACRGDRAYLARVCPGELKVVPVTLDDKMPDWQIYNSNDSAALTFFTHLAHGHNLEGEKPKDADYVFSAMFKLVWSVADRLARLHIKRTDVLSLMGRALFFRFLKDRQIVRAGDYELIAPKSTRVEDCFANADNSASTSAWLDKTFNGDLLPLTDDGDSDYFRKIGQSTGGRVFSHLTAIIEGLEPQGDSEYQLPFKMDFGTFNFAHVPVGLLSQVYERFAWKWEHDNARQTSVHYTPRNIAATLVDEAFIKLPNAHAARVLDPACGASVFLVLAFRRLYQARWKETGSRPDTKSIREILNNQLTGFDISDSALKLAALSLYLTAIELDPDPVPPSKLKFTHLKDKVLFNFRREGIDPDEGAVAGSLSEHVGRRFDGKFDLVLSNPPWTSLKAKEFKLAEELNTLSRDIIERRSDKQTANAYENPDSVPDLPFVWKATEWCKPGGRIAMALPARIFLKHEDVPRRARETFLRLVEVTGIINCANLSDTPVWPKMGQPFALVFARNNKPETGHALRLITPQFDSLLNQNGGMRVDSKSAQPVEVEAIFEQPWLLKALALGTSLDIEVIQRIKSSVGRPLQSHWENDLGLVSSNGYSLKKNPDEPEKPEQKRKYLELIKYLQGLKNLNSTQLFRFKVSLDELNDFKHTKVGRPRYKEIYHAPLALLLLSPKPQREKGWALLSFEDVAYNESFHGYSTAGHSDADRLARYLHLFTHSFVWMHYALLTSPKFGAERRQIYKTDLDECPIIPFDVLTEMQKQKVLDLSKRLELEDTAVFKEIDAFFGNLFGLDAKDLEVVRDTVEVAMPYLESRKRACNPPRPKDYGVFRKRLESILRPFFKVTGDEPQVELLKQGPLAPFGLLLISKHGTKISNPDALYREALLKLANDTGSTRIIQEMEGGLVVALLNQYRYWTPSRARLLGAELVREHLDVFD